MLLIFSNILITKANKTDNSNANSNKNNSKNTSNLSFNLSNTIANKLNGKSFFGSNSKIEKARNSNHSEKTVEFQEEKKDEEEEEKKEEGQKFDQYSGYAPIWKGYIKYFHYETDKKFKSPSEFFVNNFYFKQRVLRERLLSKGPLPGEKNKPENNLYLNIPSKFHFFATLTPHYLEINGDRKHPLTSKLESLNLDLIDNLHPTDAEKTGLKELGTYKEGKCFDLSVHNLKSYKKNFVPEVGNFRDSNAVHWIICVEVEDPLGYKSLLEFLTNLLKNRELNRKRKKSVIDGVDGEEIEEDNELEIRYEGFDKKPELDGYLLMINDWTGCTLKCGGGFSYRQYMCIPPKEGGKECHVIGETIRKRPCNTKPCPSIGTSGGNNFNNNRKVENIVEEPIIKSQVVSSRHQQNIDCVIREEDVLHEYIEAENGKTSIPTRIILNNKSITLFSDLEDRKTVFSYDIKTTQFVPIDSQPCCFKVRNENKEFKICGLSNCKVFRDSWFRSVDLFKAKCYNILDRQHEDPLKAIPPVDPSAGGDAGLAMTMEMNEELAKAKREALANKLKQKFNVQGQDSVSKTQKEALGVINREIDIEELIRKEEMIKNQEKIRVKMDEFRREQRKKEKLEEAFLKQEDSQTEVLTNIKTKQDIMDIKTKTQKEVEERRNKLKKKILKIRKLADRRSRMIEQKINIVRNEMTKQIQYATKKGNAEECKKSNGDKKLMTKYCEENVTTDLLTSIKCNSEEDFCYTCCQNEFNGVSNTEGLEKCVGYCNEKEAIAGIWERKEKKDSK